MKQRKTKRNYTYRTMRDERAYGLYWYSGLWNILRPILVVCASLVVVIGLLYSGWQMIYNGFLGAHGSPAARRRLASRWPAVTA